MKKFPPIELTITERQALAALTYHDGFKVLKRLMERQVQVATVKMLDVPPDAPNRAELIDKLQADAFAKNSFCEGLFKEINWHVQNANGEAEDVDESDVPATRAMEAAIKTGYIKP